MINILIVSGAVAIGLTAVTLGAVLAIIKIRRYRAKKRYNALINTKMNILAELQEELTEEEAIEEKNYTAPPNQLPSEANLPAEFFDTNYLEVKP
ncbi:MAG TPA: hypothetical protein VJI32_00840 [Candidatus Nanoarchaeia archaeon]|nr:hypothetical protein [Candidatus Nanoarchaeia archaeon]